MTLSLHKTKIVATIGPASSSPPVLEQMIRAGLSIARLNFSHGDFATHSQNITAIRAAAKVAGRPVSIMADLSGPKMRIGELGVEKVQLRSGDRFTLTTENVVGDRERVSVSFQDLPKVVKRGDLLSLNDGYIQLEVKEVTGREVVCTVSVGGELRPRKGLNLPGIDLGISAFTERDRECLEFALKQGVDAISQSFVECAADLHAVRKAARKLGYDPFLFAKIERARALDRLEEILDASDGLMIARGDLGVEVPIERIAVIQKEIMRQANRRAKPVITATQMLESMTTYRLPTRAEATDVSNAILDGTDCVMLSGESATGAFPVEAVTMLARIAAAVEPTRRSVRVHEMFAGVDITGRILPQHLISISVEASLEYLKPAAVFVLTEQGDSVRRLAAFRLPVWIAAVSPNIRTCQNLIFSYGVIPVHESKPPLSRNGHAREWVKHHQLPGQFAILTQRLREKDLEKGHRMDILNL
ncbi:MAG TPA: pyruvate kinase [Candidatus Binatia bacterium]|nr:pyruvate kinase [Candidatus Binatia bacterium]